MSDPRNDRRSVGSDTTITADDWPAWRAIRSSPNPELGALAPEVVLGRYRVERELGRGATGIVFAATDLERDLPVAIKLLSRVTGQRLMAFKSEFRIAASISHPNLVTPFELAAGEHGWFIAMELVEGTQFIDHVRPTARSLDVPASAFDPARLRAALLDVLDGLQALHGAGYLHRDLKSSNVLVGGDGRARIADLGLAMLKESERNTQAGPRMIVGSPAYMAPEQVEGAQLTPAADMYALGVMCFEALTGELPFDGPVHAVVLNKTLRDAPDPRERHDGLPEDLVALTRALLCRDPAARPSLVAVRALLAGASQGTGTAARSHTQQPIRGRTHELALLQDALDAVGHGEPTVVHVHGSSGVGKSALLRAFCARAGAWVLAGRCHELESIPRKGFDEVIDALHDQLVALPEMTRAAWIPESLVYAVPLFPQLVDFLPLGAPAHPETEAHSATERTLKAQDAVVDLFASIASRARLVLVLDDVQWSDPAGARLLVDLLSRPGLPLVLVLAYRTQEAANSPMLQALPALRVNHAGYREQRLEVKPLQHADCVDLALSLMTTPDPSLAERIAIESRGEPFLIEQLALYGAAQLREQGEVDDVIGARAAGLPEMEQRLLDTVALAGQPIPERLAALACGQNDVRSALSHLTTQSLLRRSGSGPEAFVYPYHDRVRVAVARRISADQRVAIHRALAHHGETERLLPPRALSDHLALSGQTERAAVYALRAAEDAETALAFDAAVESFTQALELAGGRTELRHQALVGRARALFHAGRCAEAAEAYVEAAAQAASADPESLSLRAVEAWLVSGHIERARRALEPILRAHGANYPSTTGEVLRGLLRGAVMTRVRCRRRPELQSAIDREAARRSDVLWAAGKGLIAVEPGHGAVLAYDSLLAAVRSGDAHRIARGLAVIGSGVVPFVEGVSETYLGWAREVADTLDDDHLRLMVLVGQTCRAMTAGHWQRAIETARHALELAPRVKAPTAWEESVVHTLLGSAFEYQGDLAQMERASEVCLREFRARGDAITEVIVVSAYGLTRAAAHDAGAVEHAIATMDKHIARWGLGYGQWDFYKARLQVLRALCWNDIDKARRVLDAEWPRIDGNHLLQMPFVRSPALVLRSAVLHECLAIDPASRALVKAIDKNQELLAKEPRADGPMHALISQAAMARTRGSRVEHEGLMQRVISEAKRADSGVVWRMAALCLAESDNDQIAARQLTQELNARGVADVRAWARYMLPGVIRDVVDSRRPSMRVMP